MTDRRAHTRLTDCELVVVHWNDKSRNLQQLANVADVSSGGMCLRVDHSIPVGATVKISYESLFDGILPGRVKHQVQRPEGLFLGVGFDTNDIDPMFLLS